MITSNSNMTDTPKRLSDVELENIRVWLADVERRYTLKDSERHCRALLDHIAAITAPPSQGKVERAMEIILECWKSHHIDDANAVRAGTSTYLIPLKYAIAAITQALTESSGQGTDVVTEQVIRQLDRAVAWIDEGKTYEISVLRGLLFHASSVLRRTSGTDGACCEAMREKAAKVADEHVTPTEQQNRDVYDATWDTCAAAIASDIRALPLKNK